MVIIQTDLIAMTCQECWEVIQLEQCFTTQHTRHINAREGHGLNMAQDDLLHSCNNYWWFLDGVLNTV